MRMIEHISNNGVWVTGGIFNITVKTRSGWDGLPFPSWDSGWGLELEALCNNNNADYSGTILNYSSAVDNGDGTWTFTFEIPLDLTSGTYYFKWVRTRGWSGFA